MSDDNRQLLVYNFPAGSNYEGALVGAVERIESGGAMRVVAAMFVGRQADGEPVAVYLSTTSSAGLIGKLVSFRLEDQARARATAKVMESEAGDAARSVSETLEPGEAVAAMLVEHTWASTLADAIDRMGGSQVKSEFVAAHHDELPSMLVAAVGPPSSD
jgi:hypothetical protein